MREKCWKDKTMKILKQIFWSIAAFAIISEVHVITGLILHPIGGHEFHEIFGYYSGGRLDVASKVYVEYVAISSFLAFVLILLRFPAHWIVLGSLASFIPLVKWWVICSFPYQNAVFHEACRLRLFFIPTFIMISSVLAKFILHIVYRSDTE
jgi:hypothetical protein